MHDGRDSGRDVLMRRYLSEDNERWAGFEHRPDDIVISTRSKCGTSMRAHGPDTVPDRLGVLSDPAAFFGAGRSGEGVGLCTQAQHHRYLERARSLAPTDILSFVHQGTEPGTAP